MLDLYLDREAKKFEARFRSTAQHTIAAVDTIRNGLEGLAETLDHLSALIAGAESAASSAGYEAEDTQRKVDDLASQMTELERGIAVRLNLTPETVLFRLQYLRIRVWRCFNVDRVLKATKSAEKLAPALLAHLNEAIDPAAFLQNLARVEHWEKALGEREPKRPASMTWWAAQLRASTAVRSDDAQQVLVDDVAQFTREYEDAQTYEEVELEPWDETEL